MGSASLLNNWIYREGKFSVRPGYRGTGDTLSGRPSRMITYYNALGHYDMVVGTETHWYLWNLGILGWTDLTDPANPLTGDGNTTQRFRTFMKGSPQVNYLIGVNGWGDAPKKWDGVSTYYEDVAGSPPKSKCMAVSFNRMLLGNYISGGLEYPMNVDVSAFNDFESGWGATQTVVLSETSGPLIAMREMGANIHIYKRDAIYVAVGQAAIDPFNFTAYYTGISGPVSGLAVVSLPNIHLFLAEDGMVYMFDGITLSPLSQSIQYHILNTWDASKSDKSFGFYDSRRQEVYFFYPGPDETWPVQGIIINKTNGTAWPISFDYIRPTCGMQLKTELNITIAEMTEPLNTYNQSLDSLGYIRNSLWLGNYGGEILEEYGNDDLGQPIPFDVELGLISPNPNSRDYFTVVESEHLFSKSPVSPQVVNVTLGHSDSGEDPEDEDLGPGQLNVGADGPYIVGHEDTSRMFTMKLDGDALTSIQWRGSLISGTQRGPA